MTAVAKRRIGLVLGSGSARGWAHIGVIRALAEAGVKPDLVCGCSIGALVGAVYAEGGLDKLEGWVRTLGWPEVVGLMDVSFGGGLIKGDRLMAFLEEHFLRGDFGDLQLPFGCIATELATGHEVWFRDGSVAAAVRASIATPGLFTPVTRDGKLLADGGLVDPVPVSLGRAMGAEVVIAVDLGSDIVGSALSKAHAATESAPGWDRKLLTSLGFGTDNGLPPMSRVMSAAIEIMQRRIARSRLAGEPADVLLAPRLAHFAPLDYHRGKEAIAEGRAAVQRMLPAIEDALAA